MISSSFSTDIPVGLSRLPYFLVINLSAHSTTSLYGAYFLIRNSFSCVSYVSLYRAKAKRAKYPGNSLITSSVTPSFKAVHERSVKTLSNWSFTELSLLYRKNSISSQLTKLLYPEYNAANTLCLVKQNP